MYSDNKPLGNSRNKTGTVWLRVAVSVILFMHSIPGMFNGGVNDFGTLYLNNIGLAPFGPLLAWLVKLCHVWAILSLWFNRWLYAALVLNILILLTGIILIHIKAGWFVVGGGYNGVEFNVLLIAALLQILWNEYCWRNKKEGT